MHIASVNECCCNCMSQTTNMDDTAMLHAQMQDKIGAGPCTPAPVLSATWTACPHKTVTQASYWTPCNLTCMYMSALSANVTSAYSTAAVQQHYHQACSGAGARSHSHLLQMVQKLPSEVLPLALSLHDHSVALMHLLLVLKQKTGGHRRRP